MKKLFIILLMLSSLLLQAQTYPEPEFSNEVCYLSKDSIHKLVRLEKNSSKQETNVKAADFGGVENGYIIEGVSSSVKLPSGKTHSFIFSTGSASSTTNSSADSTMRANGLDPAMMRNPMAMSDPAQNISLYKTQPGKNARKVVLIKSGGMMSMGKKAQTSNKYTFSAKKIREGYWELLIDKPLPKGEYAFVLTGAAGSSIDGSVVLYAFAID
jgi:hypothetical protein